ncbi:uncharacterized protein LOC100570366 isoform X1 [Acyrthosiphon pisum]|uniref:YqaJ viral recombinase domain-containing protein n=2 Tax=Acyrthosiphon pisum TaxID=7029 RepID=A0A8R2JPE5_ACYPI|nr:uncharacterized protein LOC100570366 isoform X1 [Acyrthosiphon pisum]
MNRCAKIQDEFIDSHELTVSSVSEVDKSLIERAGEINGCRIVDIGYVFSQILDCTHEGMFGCNFMNMEYISEFRRGYYSQFLFKCKMCNIKKKIYSSKFDENLQNQWSINKALVNSTIAIGIGYTQLAEFSAGLEIPYMSANMYHSFQSVLQDDIKGTAWSEMKAAGDEERKYAIESGSVDNDGIPLITVVADAQWSKRSYKTKYDAFSGVASIIGYKTKKILFVGIRNRYCVICERASNKNIEKPIHTCFLNWKHGATSIEADGVAEGFSKSFEMHGVKYSKLIGDGDSSVTKRLNEILPYGPSLRVEKIECRNHMLRNYSQKMSALTKRTEFPIAIRKKIADNLVRLRTDVTKAIQYRKSEEKPLQQKILNLKYDITNAPNHRLFDCHKKCAPYFCEKSADNSVGNCKSNENDGIVKEINIIVSRLANNAKSLILDVDNNICEQFNSVINKFLGGKRINYNQRSSYNTRILAAVVSFNSSEYLRAVKKHITQTSPGKTAKSFLSQIIKKRSACQKRRQLSTKLKYKVKRPKASSKPDEHYGNADILDGIREVDDPSFVKDMEQFLKTLYDVNRTTVEETTRYQAESENWRAERMIRLTASNFGRVCKMRRNTSCKNIVHSILYLTFNSKSVQYGRDMEDEAKTKFEENFGYKIKKCGLFIDTQIPYLAASPDGIIGDTAIVEIKCPYAAKDTENEIEAVSTGKLKYCSIKENKLVLSKNHIYYYQIQGQLHISQKEQCFFIIYTTNWMSVQIIKYDDDFWSTQMVDKLKTFYLNCLLPEIVDPVYKYRFMKSDIRESKIILQQMKISKQLF